MEFERITFYWKILSRSGPPQLLAPCWPDQNAPVKEIWLQWRRDCRNWGLLWGHRRIILEKRHRKVREALEWMYYAWRKLCWWIKTNFSIKLCFSLLDSKLIEWCVTSRIQYDPNSNQLAGFVLPLLSEEFLLHILIHGYIYQSYPRSFLEEYRSIFSLRYNGTATTAWCNLILSLYFWYRY